MKFKLNHGSHSEMRWIEATLEQVAQDLPGTIKRANGKYYIHKVVNYNAPAEIETDKDLVALFNGRNVPNLGGLGPKFTALSESTPTAPVSAYPNPWENLESMTIPQLQQFAASQEVDVKSCKTKAEIIEHLLEVVTG